MGEWVPGRQPGWQWADARCSAAAAPQARRASNAHAHLAVCHACSRSHWPAPAARLLSAQAESCMPAPADRPPRAPPRRSQAMAAYRTANRLFPGLHGPLMGMGMEYQRMNNLGLAEQCFSQVRPGGCRPRHSVVALGACLLASLSCLVVPSPRLTAGRAPPQAAKLCPSDPLAANELGVLAYRNRDYQAAARWLHRALEQLPGGRPTTGAGRQLLRPSCRGSAPAGQPWRHPQAPPRPAAPGATPALRPLAPAAACVLSQQPAAWASAACLPAGWEPALVNLGHTLRKLRQWDAAIDCYRQALGLKPGQAREGGRLLVQGDEPARAAADQVGVLNHVCLTRARWFDGQACARPALVHLWRRPSPAALWCLPRWPLIGDTPLVRPHRLGPPAAVQPGTYSALGYTYHLKSDFNAAIEHYHKVGPGGEASGWGMGLQRMQPLGMRQRPAEGSLPDVHGARTRRLARPASRACLPASPC